MAARKKKFDFMAMAMATGGGIAAGIIDQQLQKVEFLQKNKYVGPLALSAVGAGLGFFAPNLQALGLGISGAAGAQLGATLNLMQGPARIAPSMNAAYDNPYLMAAAMDAASEVDAVGSEMNSYASYEL